MQATINGRQVEWTPGVLGTSQWVRDERTRRYGTPDGSAETRFKTLPAPGAVAEPVDGPRTIRADRPEPDARRERGIRANVRRLLAAGWEDNRAAERRVALLAARAVETARRQRLALASIETAPQPRGEAVEDGRLSDEATPDEYRGTDLRTLLALAEPVGEPVVLPAVPRRILSRFEAAVDRLDNARRDLTRLAARTPDRDGRGTWVDPRQRWGVNATEVRGSERWTGTPRALVTGQDGRALDWQAYRVLPGGRREPFTSATSEDETPTTRRVAATDNAGAYAARLAAFGATGNTPDA